MDKTNSLAVYQDAYEVVMNLNLGPDRDAALSLLMTNMERQYHIPMQAHPEWNAKHRKVITLYRKIADSRTTI
ncbi:hypothetical protein [Alicyclobacillus sp. ALC3]|uniref:hypothetical protein n=1 Tax=Alicyclobacillus sp. ALC3 TaxID=2796143 RepID=UPI0023797BC6|nr:hypothetical protein [Alicyclobacillus sp. ALC3]WDL97837.1 hypothetical protein JC200_03645 [Alicyclobacillus sp. ALC3]